MITCVGHLIFPFRDPHSHHEQYPRISRYGDLFSFAYRRFTPPLVHGNPISFDGLYGSEIHHESLISMDDDPMVYRVSIVDGTAKPSQSTKLIPLEIMATEEVILPSFDPKLQGKDCVCTQNSDGSLKCVCKSLEEHNKSRQRLFAINIIISIIVTVLVIIYVYKLLINPNPNCLKTHMLPLLIMMVMIVYILFLTW
jgi:hypothetical protein